MYGKRKSLFEKFNQIDTEIIDEKLKIDENVTIYLINGLYLKVNKGNFDLDNINELDKSVNIVLSSRSKKDIILLSNQGKSYVLPIEKIMGKTQKGKQISNFLRMKDKEKIIDCFEYNQKEKILLSTLSGKMLQVLSDDLYTIKKSGKKIMNIVVNDNLFGCIKINNTDNFISIFLNKKDTFKLMIIKKDHIPLMQKGSGVKTFNNVNFKVCSLAPLNKDLIFKDIYEKPLKNFQFKSYVTTRQKSAKNVSEKVNLNFYRGFENNIKIIND